MPLEIYQGRLGLERVVSVLESVWPDLVVPLVAFTGRGPSYVALSSKNQGTVVREDVTHPLLIREDCQPVHTHHRIHLSLMLGRVGPHVRQAVQDERAGEDEDMASRVRDDKFISQVAPREVDEGEFVLGA